ncbi:hypothetical protein DFH11DRAFT_1629658 [Phellopilus nigrolimitatus]|nr:hypothetical protein DFH11DRAFT_1629658 [Phellopilus nigrolimitatus]
MILLAALASMLFSRSSFVSAQVAVEGGFRFEADPLTIGDLAIWCIFDLVFLIIAGLCVVPIMRLRVRRPQASYAYMILLAASLFTAIQASFNIAYIIYTNNALAFPNVEKAAVLQDFTVFFGNWSSPLLYCALVLLLRDRQKHFLSSQTALKKSEALLYDVQLGFVALLVLLATVTSGLLANQNVLVVRFDDLGQDATLEDFQRAVDAEQRYQNSLYVFEALWSFSALCFAGLAAYVYVCAKNVGLHDKVVWMMHFAVTPLYILGAVQGIVFTILFSPAVQVTTLVEQESITLSSDILNNIFYAALSVIVLAAGFKRAYWLKSDQRDNLVHLGVLDLPSGNYLELEDPPLQK